MFDRSWIPDQNMSCKNCLLSAHSIQVSRFCVTSGGTQSTENVNHIMPLNQSFTYQGVLIYSVDIIHRKMLTGGP